jgi:RNA polymerase sigma factor (sigma-70 family)
MSAAADLTNAIRHLRTPDGDTAGDPELLDRYAHGHDQAAFAVLVRRYGPLVLGVARRQVADPHRADDVFQATFLALARSAAVLGGRPAVANWLYTVALRQARKARGRDARRQSAELSAPARPEGADPLAEITGRELLRVVDEELARLPDRLRLPVLLCCVQGLSRDEAARRLGWSDGSVKGRLERGRRRLAARLAARGLAPSAMVLAPLAAVAVPPDLAARTAELAASPWSRTVPPTVAALAAARPVRSLAIVAALAGCLVAGIVGVTVALGGKQPVEPTAQPAAAAPAQAARPAPDDDPLTAGATRRFGSSRYRHPTTIEGLAVSADGTLAVAHSGTRVNAKVRAYDLATGRPGLTLNPEPGGGFVEGVTVSADGKTIAVKRQFSVYLHDAATGQQTARIEYPSANPYSGIDLLAFSPDGKRVVVAAAEGKALHVIDLAKGKVVHTLPHAHVVFAAAFSPDSKHVVGGGYDSEKNVYFARVWDAETGAELRRLRFGNGGIRSIAYSPDGATIAVGGDGGSPVAVKLFDAATGKERLKVPFPGASSVRSVAFSPDSKTLAASGGTSTRLFDAGTGNEKLVIDRKAIGLRFAPDGSLVGAVAGTIYRWDTATGKSLIPEGGDSPVAQIEVTADGKRLVTRGQDGDAHVWDARTDEYVRRVAASWQRGLALSRDGRFLVWPVDDEKVQYKDPEQPNATITGSRLRLLDLTTGTFVERFGGGFEGNPYELSFSPDGKALTTVDHRNGAVRVWDVDTGKVARSFRVSGKGQQYHVWRSRSSPDGKVLAAAYHPDRNTRFFGRHAVKLWDTATGAELHDLPGHWGYVEGMAFSADGKYLATAGEALAEFAQKQLQVPADQVFVWEVATGKAVARLPGGGTGAAFAPDGKALAVALPDGTIRLWETATWQVRGEFRGPRDRVTALTFGPDGELFSGSVTATVLAWDPKAAAPPVERK